MLGQGEVVRQSLSCTAGCMSVRLGWAELSQTAEPMSSTERLRLGCRAALLLASCRPPATRAECADQIALPSPVRPASRGTATVMWCSVALVRPVMPVCVCVCVCGVCVVCVCVVCVVCCVCVCVSDSGNGRPRALTPITPSPTPLPPQPQPQVTTTTTVQARFESDEG